MNMLYSKGKGKIHPSPASHPTAAGDVLAVLKLLPASIVALLAVLAADDKEVLAYLITRSINGGPPSTAAEHRPRGRRPPGGGGHRAAFDCGCFECYTRFWYRWDCSPNRELIHEAIEAFEDHLASKEEGAVRGRRRGKKGKDKVMKKKAEAVDAAVEVAVNGGESCSSKVEEGGDDLGLVTMDDVAAGGEGEDVAASGVERRGRWPDVMGMFNSRLWSLWSPGV